MYRDKSTDGARGSLVLYSVCHMYIFSSYALLNCFIRRDVENVERIFQIFIHNTL